MVHDGEGYKGEERELSNSHTPLFEEGKTPGFRN